MAKPLPCDTCGGKCCTAAPFRPSELRAARIANGGHYPPGARVINGIPVRPEHGGGTAALVVVVPQTILRLVQIGLAINAGALPLLFALRSNFRAFGTEFRGFSRLLLALSVLRILGPVPPLALRIPRSQGFLMFLAIALFSFSLLRLAASLSIVHLPSAAVPAPTTIDAPTNGRKPNREVVQ